MPGLTNFDILHLVNELGIPNFRGVFMRDTLPPTARERECGVVNLNTSKEPGSHWVCYYKNGRERIYFDSFGQVTPIEIQKYLKTKREFDNDVPVIQRNTDIVQKINTSVCGQLCLFVLEKLSKEGANNFQDVINTLNNGK